MRSDALQRPYRDDLGHSDGHPSPLAHNRFDSNEANDRWGYSPRKSLQPVQSVECSARASAFLGLSH